MINLKTYDYAKFEYSCKIAMFCFVLRRLMVRIKISFTHQRKSIKELLHCCTCVSLM